MNWALRFMTGKPNAEKATVLPTSAEMRKLAKDKRLREASSVIAEGSGSASYPSNRARTNLER